jgi:hypothetical protein
MAENKNIPQGANKYSVYAQRNVESTQVDWNKIAGELTKGAEAIRDERQGRKDAIDTETQNSIEQLSKVEGANNQDAASLLINGSSMSVEALRVQTDMLKRGLIKPKDYKLFMQQQKNGYANLNTAVKGWDKWATEAKERLKIAEGTLGPKAGGLEIYQNNLTSALGNLKNKKLWSNPINGQLQLVTMGKDKGGSYNVMPDYFKNKAAYQNPNTMNDLMKYQQDRFNLPKATKGVTSKVGQIIKAFVSGPSYNVLTGGGAVKTVSDFRQFGEFGSDLSGKKITYDQWKQKQIDTITGRVGDANNENAAQILFNSGGYKYAQTIEEFKENNPGLDESYWMKADVSGSRPVPTLSPAQMKEARSLADTEIESQIAHVESLTKGASGQQKQQPTNAANAAKARETQLIGFIDDTNALASDDQSTFEATANDRIIALNSKITNKDERIDNIKRDDKQIVFELANGAKIPIERLETDGTPRPIRDVVKDMYRLVAPTNEQNSYKEARLLYEAEPGGGFRDADRDLNDIEKTVLISEQKAVSKLKSENITPTIKDPKNPKKQITNPNYEKELKKEIIEQTKNISQAEKDAVKKRVLKNITGSKYQALPPLPRIVQPTKGIVGGFNTAGKPEMKTGTEVIDSAIGGRLDGLSTMTGDDAVEVNKALSDVMNGYLPEELEGGAKVEFAEDKREKIKDPNDETLEIDNPNKGEWSLSVSYFDRSGTQQTLPIQYPDVGSIIPGSGGATPSELNTMIHEAAEKIGTEESERLVNRNQRGTSKKRKKFNG